MFSLTLPIILAFVSAIVSVNAAPCSAPLGRPQPRVSIRSEPYRPQITRDLVPDASSYSDANGFFGTTSLELPGAHHSRLEALAYRNHQHAAWTKRTISWPKWPKKVVKKLGGLFRKGSSNRSGREEAAARAQSAVVSAESDSDSASSSEEESSSEDNEDIKFETDLPGLVYGRKAEGKAVPPNDIGRSSTGAPSGKLPTTVGSKIGRITDRIEVDAIDAFEDEDGLRVGLD